MELRDELQKIKWVDISTVKPNPKNVNDHDDDQINDIVESIKAFGWRDYIIVSNKSGLVTSGHGTLLAAKKLKCKKVPVMYQDFESPEQEYVFGVAINNLRKRSKINLGKIHLDLPEMDPTLFNVDHMFFAKDFRFEPLEDKKEEPSVLKKITCPHCGESFEKGQAKEKSL